MINAQEIPWKRITVEGAAIVASILLAFAIDAWWSEVQERDFENETLVSLLEEFKGHRAELNVQRKGHGMMLTAFDGLISYAKTGVYSSDEFSLDRSMYFLRIPLTTDFGSGVREALISSGQLGVISNKELRYEVAEWSSVLDELKDDQVNGSNLVFNFILPYMVREAVPIPDFDTLFSNDPMTSGTRSVETEPETMKRIFNDPQFLTILEIRQVFLVHTIGEYDSLIDATDSIITKLKVSLVD